MQDVTWQQAIAAELSRLDSLLKQSTVEAYIQQRLLGQPYDTDAFWGRADTCARSTWHKWKKHDPAFTDILEKAWAIARGYRAAEAAEAITEAVLTLQLHAPDMASRIIQLAADPDAGVALRAATAALDRASKLTAPKGTPVTIHGLDDAIERIYGHDPPEVPGDEDDPP